MELYLPPRCLVHFPLNFAFYLYNPKNYSGLIKPNVAAVVSDNYSSRSAQTSACTHISMLVLVFSPTAVPAEYQTSCQLHLLFTVSQSRCEPLFYFQIFNLHVLFTLHLCLLVLLLLFITTNQPTHNQHHNSIYIYIYIYIYI